MTIYEHVIHIGDRVKYQYPGTGGKRQWHGTCIDLKLTPKGIKYYVDFDNVGVVRYENTPILTVIHPMNRTGNPNWEV